MITSPPSMRSVATGPGSGSPTASVSPHTTVPPALTSTVPVPAALPGTSFFADVEAVHRLEAGRADAVADGQRPGPAAEVRHVRVVDDAHGAAPARRSAIPVPLWPTKQSPPAFSVRSVAGSPPETPFTQTTPSPVRAFAEDEVVRHAHDRAGLHVERSRPAHPDSEVGAGVRHLEQRVESGHPEPRVRARWPIRWWSVAGDGERAAHGHVRRVARDRPHGHAPRSPSETGRKLSVSVPRRYRWVGLRLDGAVEGDRVGAREIELRGDRLRSAPGPGTSCPASRPIPRRRWPTKGWPRRPARRRRPGRPPRQARAAIRAKESACDGAWRDLPECGTAARDGRVPPVRPGPGSGITRGGAAARGVPRGRPAPSG